MQYTGERVIPWNMATGMTVLCCHVARYAWAIPRTFGSTVIDLGCGCGYGAFMLSWGAREVAGFDVNGEAIDFARAHFRADNLTFDMRDICELLNLVCDIYVAFEVLEHLSNPALIKDHYRPLLWSMPINDASRFHPRAYSLPEIDRLMGTANWLQSSSGEIVARGQEWFQPTFALGLTQ
jgi:SAM-dependent methyltransferase